MGKEFEKKMEKIKININFLFFTIGSNSHHKPLRQKMLMSPFIPMKNLRLRKLKNFSKIDSE